MQIEFLNVHRGEHLVNFDTDTPEGRAKLAEEFQRLVKCGTSIFLERAGKEGTDTLRVTGYDPGTDKIVVEEPREPEEKREDLTDENLRTEKENREMEGKPEPTSIPEELQGKTANVGDVLHAKATGRKRRGRYKVTKVDAASGHIVAVAPVSGGLDNAAARARNLFKTAGYSVVYMLKDDFFTLRPLDSHEQKSMGTACLSARAMTVIGNELLSESTGHDAEIRRIAAALGSAPQIEDIVAKIKALKK
jgi:hypothetical protein